MERILIYQKKTHEEIEELELSCGGVNGLAIILDLGKPTVEALKKERSTEVEHLFLLTNHDFDKMDPIPLRDRKSLLEYIKDNTPNVQKPSVVEVLAKTNGTRNVDKNAPTQVDVRILSRNYSQGRTESSMRHSVEYDLHDAVICKNTLLLNARELPRPHTSMYELKQTLIWEKRLVLWT